MCKSSTNKVVTEELLGGVGGKIELEQGASILLTVN